jgi:hypothetical protein
MQILKLSYKIIFWTLLPLLALGCTIFFKIHKDPFYNDSGGFDSFRFPLAKPYELKYLNEKTSWDMELQANPPSESTYYYLTLHDIQKLDVQSGTIMLYTPYVEHNIDLSVGQKVYHWFVIVPASNSEEGFESEDAFLEYISQLNIMQVNWQTPDDLYSKFTETGCLDWIPGCH